MLTCLLHERLVGFGFTSLVDPIQKLNKLGVFIFACVIAFLLWKNDYSRLNPFKVKSCHDIEIHICNV